MLKQSLWVIGLGLSLSLGGCTQTDTAVESSVDKATADGAADILEARPAKPEMDKPARPRETRGERPRADRRAPSPEAFDACAAVELGNACSFETPRGAREGICRQRDDMDSPFCAPKRREGDRGDRPPRPRGE